MSKTLYFIVVSILAILAYLLYTSMNTQEHFSMRANNVFHPVTDEAPSMCNTDSQCETKKCTTNGYCAI